MIAYTCFWDNVLLFDGEQDPSPSAQETSAVELQLDRRAKMKEPSFHYTA
ncbi:unnamed protein product [Spirodela intermedia]|uniref:Uncharacterized protein n=1 Tax=Spirodela intermedia TaxID=51605 RepID=A0A7I8LMT4_SPIIN|nr:unnamed protein product [Spirodela intermedia]